MDKEKATSVMGAKAESAIEATFARDAENPAVCVADGFGVRVTTSSGRLKVTDGIGRQRRERYYSRATHGLARVVAMATSGYFTFDALRWLEGAGIGLVVLDPMFGGVVTASTRVANDDARLRRAQALALGTDTGLDIARYLTQVKLAGQAQIASTELGTAQVALSISDLGTEVADSASLEEVRQLEATAANLYWSAWSKAELSFVKKDLPRVPDNWAVFEGRRSSFTVGSARNATDPINALLNYLYRLVEAEGHLATLAVGLDPGLGILHADVKGRASFVLDLMEAARPVAERHVLRLLRERPLRWRDFHEDEHGVVTVLPPLTHRLAEAMPAFGVALAPVVERVSRMLAAASPYDVVTPTVLTREKHRAAARRRTARAPSTGNAGQGPGPSVSGLEPRSKRRQRPRLESEPALPLPVCKACGLVLGREPNGRRDRGGYCSRCLSQRRAELGATLPEASGVRNRAFAERTGTPPSHSPEAQERRRRAFAEQKAEEENWEAQHCHEEPDREWFTI